jgi:hypothetical protein
MKKDYLLCSRFLIGAFYMICSLAISAQENITTFFSCPQVKGDVEKFNSLKKSDKKWAEGILSFHPITTNGIQYTYLIESKDTFIIDAMMNNTRAWFDKTTSSGIMAIKTFDKEKHVIEAAVALEKIGEASTYGKISVVSAIINYQISFKHNRIKFDVWVSNFNIYSASNFASNKAFVVPVNKCYPVDKTGKHKASLAMAFINANSACLNSANSFIKFIEEHHKENIKSYDDNW